MSTTNEGQPERSMATTYLLWIFVMLVVVGGGFAYFTGRILLPLKLTGAANITAWSGAVLLFAFPFVMFWLIRHNEQWSDALAWVAYISLGFLSLVVTLLLARDIVLLAGLIAERSYLFAQKLFSDGTAAQLVDASRREFLLQATNLGVIGAAGVLTAYGVYEARRKPGIVNITVPIKGLPKEFAGFKIVQITDIHAGLTVKRDWVETIAREVEALKPDLIAFTGDLADGSVPHLRGDVAPFGDLQAAHGKFFVTGNHEYYSGVEPWVEEARRLGYDVLVNEHRLVQRHGSSMILAGVTDPTGAQFLPHTHTPDAKAAFENAPPDTVKILLAHQPRAVYDAQPLGVDLMISGHTHGGQFFPWNLVAALGQPYISGLHDHNGMWVYVSRGTGYWGPPVRLGARSEITVITLAEKSYA